MEKNKFDIKELGFIPPIYGGVSVSIARLINKLTADGFIVGGFYTPENQDPKIIHSELFEPELNMSTKKIIFCLPKCLRILAPYKVLHSHYSLEHMIYIWCFLHFLHKKVVITVHNSMVQRFYQECDFINRIFLKLVAKSPDVTWIAVSKQAKEEMLDLPIRFKNEIHVIPAYIPDESVKICPLPNDLRDYIDRHDKNIVFYGHSFMLHEGKDVYGFGDALNLYAELLKYTDSHIGLVLCLSDDKDSDKIEKLHEHAAALNIDTHIYWQIGALTNMNALWQSADVYVRPTSTDGDSLAVREALDMGIQVVASDVCPRPSKTKVYKAGDKEDFYAKVKIALSEQRMPVLLDYSNYQKVKDIYEQLMNDYNF